MYVQGMEKVFKYLDWFSNGVEQVGFQGSNLPITGIVQADIYLHMSQEYYREYSCDDMRLDIVVI